MQKIRVAFLMHGIFYGGATRSLQLLIDSLQKYNLDLFIYTCSSRSDALKADLEGKPNVNFLKVLPIGTISNNQVAYDGWDRAQKTVQEIYYDFIQELKKYKIDILHINSSVFPHISRQIKKVIPEIKIIVHVRELIPKYEDGQLQAYFINELTTYTDKLICISDNEKQCLNEPPIATIIPNPFDFSRLRYINPILRKQYNIGEDTVLVGMLSHFSEPKGHLDFLKAISIIQNNENYDFDKIKFVIIGVKKTSFLKLLAKKIILNNDYELRVRRFIRRKSLKKAIIQIPYTTRPLDYIADLDILVRPALTGDPWGRDIIEGMALKKPIIATGESQFYIKDGFTGFLVPPNEPNQLATKIIELIKNKQKRDQFGNAGFNIIKEKCDLDNNGKKVYEIYKDLICL